MCGCRSDGSKLTTAADVGTSLCCAIGPGGEWLVSGHERGRLTIWDLGSGGSLRSLVGHDDAVRGCAVTFDGDQIVSVGEDAMLRVWDADTGAEAAHLPIPGWILSVATHPLFPHIVFGDIMGGVYQAELIGLGESL